MRLNYAAILCLTVSFLWRHCEAFPRSERVGCRSMLRRPTDGKPTATAWALSLSLSDTDKSIAVWTVLFASSHIGMSAIRESIIQQLGKGADRLGLVGNDEWTLPSFWPGDSVGGNRIFPNTDTAGRQLYRALYTLVSFTTLGSAFALYLSTTPHYFESSTPPSPFCYYTAVAANTAALSSLANASPLGLMPAFTPGTDDDGSVVLERNDALKFSVRGLTRITRHPLILPVVPWGFCNAFLLGNRPCDWIFFGGLSFYAIVGCAAQDLRVSRQEGSVGTVFSSNEQKEALQAFFQSTSFVPFGAIVDGRQELSATLREVPWLAVVPASLVGYVIEEKMLQCLGSF